jgi:hypothetical protein
MVQHYNPSLRQEPRYQAIPIIPSKSTETLLEWLQRTGRLEPREIDSSLKGEVLEDLENSIDRAIYASEEE